MQKTYERINWEDLPSTNTALSEDNLNKMDSALNEIDTRVVNLYGYEERASESAENAEQSELNAKTSEEITAENAKIAQSYAVGGTDYRTDEDVDNAKYYYEKSKEISDNFSDTLTRSDVVDNLTSTDTDLPLSANQGRVLDEKISAIGTNQQLNTYNATIPNGVTTKFDEMTLSPGKYIFFASAIFSGNSNGMRGILISSSANVVAANVIKNGVSATPWTNLSTNVRYSTITEYTAETKIALYAYQNSGSDLTIERTGFYALKIK